MILKYNAFAQLFFLTYITTSFNIHTYTHKNYLQRIRIHNYTYGAIIDSLI